MRFGLLGPVVLRRDGALAPVRAPMARNLLAGLLLSANQLVTTDRLIDIMWGTDPPPTAVHSLHNHVMRLRAQLDEETAGNIQTATTGYLLHVAAADLDLELFTQQVRRGHQAKAAGDWETAANEFTAALALWRGDPLADVTSPLLRTTKAPQISQLRLDTLEARVDVWLQLGRYGEAIDELTELTADRPLRERFHGQLMLACSMAGRRADALEAYRRAWRILNDELGVEPGAELQQLHQRILAADPALAGTVTANVTTALPAAQSGNAEPAEQLAVPVPAQLPLDPADFTGRDEEYKTLRGLLSAEISRVGPGAVVISAIGGMGGVGKTSLAVHTAHRLRERFPDGQLFVSLQGSTNPLEPVEVLARLLRDLGVPDSAIPVGEAERAAHYRSVLAVRSMLIVLDDASDSTQVQPLLPGTAACAVIITSRATLADLPGAAHIGLDALDDSDSRALFTAIVGRQRAEADPDGTEGILKSCAGLPLAIRIAGSRLASRASWTTGKMSRLLASERRRLAELATGDLAVRASFEVSYRALPQASPDPARVFRLIGLAGLPSISLPAVAALADAATEDAAAAMEILLDAHLVDSPEPDRFTLHDLLRLYAVERAAQDETDESRHEALHRLLAWYLHTVSGCIPLLGSKVPPVSLAPLPAGVPALSFDDPADALGWLQDEHANLIQAATLAATHGMDDACWQLAWLGTEFLKRTGYWTDQKTVGRRGLAAAERSGNKTAIAGMLNVLGGAHGVGDEFPAAIEHFERSLAIWRELGDRGGEAKTLSNLALAELHAGQTASAIIRLADALAINRERGNRVGEGYALHNLGYAHQLSGELPEALTSLSQALAIRTEQGDTYRMATTLHSMGIVLLGLGRISEAMEHLERALAISRDGGMSHIEGMTLASLGDGLRALDRLSEARARWRQALDILSSINYPDAEAVRDRLRIADAVDT
jgi:DNA-binding SARP family transcriptional activator/Tfp pilus assembly protein PilF